MKELIEFIEYLDKQGIRLPPDILSGFIKMKAKQKTLTDKIIEIVCKKFKLSIDEIKSGGRKHIYVEPKQIICYFLIKSKVTVEKIADIVGCKHPNVTYSNKVVKNLIDSDYNYAEKIEQLKKLIEKL